VAPKRERTETSAEAAATIRRIAEEQGGTFVLSQLLHHYEAMQGSGRASDTVRDLETLLGKMRRRWG